MSGNGTIRGTIITNGDRATLQIADEGKGMTEEELARAFDPFYTTKENGTGLGLAVTYGIVEGHGGSITLASTPGEGTTVSINLPLAHHTENMF
jgi:signal transduction histidine kinase